MRWAAYRLMRLLGWSFIGRLPPVPKLVIVGAPHTSNWDFMLFLAALHAYRIKARFIGKHTLFRWPFGYLFRALGGIPVDRSRQGGAVRQVADAFARAEEMILVIAPEGTRSAVPHWKSGFLNIAEEAGVPIVFAGVDGTSKEVILSEPFSYDGDAGAVMDFARDFYRGKRGLRPEGAGPIRIQEDVGP